ncbi:hypothetical protein SAMN05421504_1021005 [Amycolatopsis xylanica]|uniref:Uncharacterized protein n=1 Tax=Amycolatopsis xylanica TaxID=589385 RepID=A0A1H3AP69_9PSEU|nr:hypothetical protein [Amycolatopsis xylanica]SDX31497.1 hypothetical protein SAMN05421504_1021005 [Amycolatopsis xylanica]
MTTADWKRAAYGLLALPAFLGGARAQRWLARKLLGAEPGMGKPRYFAALVPSLVTFFLAVLIWYLVGRIATYGIFWDQSTGDVSWGGPSLLGAWVVHFFAALGMAVVCSAVLRPLTRLQNRLLSPVVPGAPREIIMANS